LAWAYEYLHHCHRSKKEVLALKLDFEKAFDKVDHTFILQVLQAKGFGNLWCLWIKQLFCSASSAVLLNGIPGSSFRCRRGVRQGDPLSPLLFVLAADVLQSLINLSLHQEMLKRPLNLQSSHSFPILQYADDTLVIMEADVAQLQHLTEILQNFGNATVLRVNYTKSNLILINIPDNRVHLFTSTLNCQLGSLPFTYLGLPLSTTKPRKEFFMPLIQCIQRRLPACTMYINYGSKLRMLNSVLSSLPMFYLCSLKLYQWVLAEVDKYRRHCLWRDKDLHKMNPPLAIWDLVCKPKDQGSWGPQLGCPK
jgi:hypothetical protein